MPPRSSAKKDNSKRMVESPSAMLPAPSHDMTPARLDNVFASSDDENVYAQYEYNGSYDIPDVRDLKWHHTKKADRAEIDMGINELAQVVGSKRARDISRRTHFMTPNALAAWKRKYDTNNRYAGSYTDLDGDETDEYVVTHTDKSGNQRRVAVNGWVTKKSDYPLRSEWIQANPTHAERRANKFKSFIDGKYRIQDNMDAYGFPSHKYLEDRLADKARSKFESHMPIWNARNEFMKKVIWRAYKIARDAFVEQGHTASEIQSKFNTVHGHGWVTQYGNARYKSWIVEPVLEALRETQYYANQMADYAKRFRNSKNPVDFNDQNPAHIAKFEASLMKKDTFRQSLNAEVHHCLNTKEEYRNALNYIANVFMDKIGEALEVKSPRNSPQRQYLAQYEY